MGRQAQKNTGLCLDGKFKLITSPEIVNEIRKVLLRKKFDFIEQDIKDEFILLLSKLAEIVFPKQRLNICRDEGDDKFIETAITANANYVVTGDDDLLAVKEYKGIKIISSDEFLKIVENK